MKFSNFNSKNTTSSTKNIPEQGRHAAICIGVIHAGSQPDIYKGEGHTNPTAQIQFELPFCHDRDGHPFKASHWYNLSLSTRANFRKLIDGMNGTPLTTEQLLNMEMTWLLGKTCELDITHAEKNGYTNPRIIGAYPLSKGRQVPNATNDAVYFDLEKPDLQVFSRLSAGVKDMIQRSPEWQALPYANNWVEAAISERLSAFRTATAA